MGLNKTLFIAICPLILAATACSTTGTRSESAMAKESQDASKQVAEATQVVQKMETEPGMKSILQNARGVFIVPHFGQGALLIGASGGEGILLVKNGNTWSDPAFYKFGGLSAGLQAGGQGGVMALVLNNDKAVQHFMNKNNFQFNANAGITVVDWERAAQAGIGQADVVAWSDVKGLFGGAAIGLQDVRFDQNDSNGFYGQTVALNDILNGKIKAPKEKTAQLKQVLSRRPAALTGGSTSSDSSHQ